MPYADPEKQAAYQRDYLARRRQEYLKDRACVQCGSRDRLEVDHIDPDQKVSHRIWSWSTARREAELAKCQVLCQPCHSRKTAEQTYGVAECGTVTRYRKGCRCSDCRAAKAADMRAWRRAVAVRMAVKSSRRQAA